MHPRRRFSLPVALLLAAAGSPFTSFPEGVYAQEVTSSCQEGMAPVAPLEGTLERIQVHGTSLEGNLEGDSPDRCVSVYLPPSYGSSPERRYPVVYILHGYTDDDQHWFGWTQHFVNVPAGMEKAMTAGTAREMILVMPNAYTLYQGSMYSSSVTTGDWETFVAEDLVAYVDSHYRTLARRESRGLAGHSMGGYGAIRIGMKRPDVFASDYVLSPCCMVANLNPGGPQAAQVEAVERPEDAADLPFGARATMAEAAAWSPNPDNPPFYFDLPTKNGEIQPQVVAAWVANAPLAMVYQYVANLNTLHALAMDAGAQDRGIAASAQELDSILTRFGVPHTFEIYDPGDHINRVQERMEDHVLPFFSKNLVF
jgi:S-formylglutathione hydrolase FrmB